MKTKINLIVVLIVMTFSSAIYAQDSSTRLEELKKELDELNIQMRPKSERIKEIDLDWIDRGRPSGELADNQERKKLLGEIERILDLGTLKYERDNRNDRIYYRGNRRVPKGGDSEN